MRYRVCWLYFILDCWGKAGRLLNFAYSIYVGVHASLLLTASDKSWSVAQESLRHYKVDSISGAIFCYFCLFLFYTDTDKPHCYIIAVSLYNLIFFSAY